MQIIHLDIGQRHGSITVHAKQGDVGRKIRLCISDNGQPWPIPDGAVCTVWFSGSSGEGNYTAVGDHPAFTINGNTVEVELITQMLTNAGGGILCIVLNGVDGQQLGLWNMMYMCEPLPGSGSVEAGNYYTAMSEIARNTLSAVTNFKTDPTLSISGKAADAAEVGAALELKAPAGFGHGMIISGRTQKVSDLNDATLATGYYYCTMNTLNVPESGFGGGPLYVLNWIEDTLCCQVLMNNNLSQCYVRRCLDGEWQPWAYVNPPMLNKVLYHTMEQHNGKPVYTMRITSSKLPNTAHMLLATGLSSADYPNLQLIYAQVMLKVDGKQYINPTNLPLGTFGFSMVSNLNKWYLDVGTNFDGSGIPVDATLKFTLE